MGTCVYNGWTHVRIIHVCVYGLDECICPTPTKPPNPPTTPPTPKNKNKNSDPHPHSPPTPRQHLRPDADRRANGGAARPPRGTGLGHGQDPARARARRERQDCACLLFSAFFFCCCCCFLPSFKKSHQSTNQPTNPFLLPSFTSEKNPPHQVLSVWELDVAGMLDGMAECGMPVGRIDILEDLGNIR